MAVSECFDFMAPIVTAYGDGVFRITDTNAVIDQNGKKVEYLLPPPEKHNYFKTMSRRK